MDPTREPRSHDTLPDDAVVAYLRARAPGLPTVRFDARAVISRARGAARRRRQLRTSAVAIAAAAATYLALAFAGPLPVTGLGTVSVPGGAAVRALVGGLVPGGPPAPSQWPADVDRLETEVLPVVEELEVSYYLLHPGPCRILEYRRGDYSDQQDCQEMTPFDAEAAADFERVKDAVERSGVPVERIVRHGGGIYIPLEDSSWRYNWEYVYLPDADSPPPTMWPEEEWTHIRGDWWFHRAHDD
jgi:hypothetical protein